MCCVRARASERDGGMEPEDDTGTWWPGWGAASAAGEEESARERAWEGRHDHTTTTRCCGVAASERIGVGREDRARQIMADGAGLSVSAGRRPAG